MQLQETVCSHAIAGGGGAVWEDKGNFSFPLHKPVNHQRIPPDLCQLFSWFKSKEAKGVNSGGDSIQCKSLTLGILPASNTYLALPLFFLPHQFTGITSSLPLHAGVLLFTTLKHAFHHQNTVLECAVRIEPKLYTVGPSYLLGFGYRPFSAPQVRNSANTRIHS